MCDLNIQKPSDRFKEFLFGIYNSAIKSAVEM